jgi:hypothetical protein
MTNPTWPAQTGGSHPNRSRVRVERVALAHTAARMLVPLRCRSGVVHFST